MESLIFVVMLIGLESKTIIIIFLFFLFFMLGVFVALKGTILDIDLTKLTQLERPSTGTDWLFKCNVQNNIRRQHRFGRCIEINECII